MRRASPAGFPSAWGAYERAFIDYPGQEALGRAKRRNQALLAAALDRVVVAPGEVLSIWRLAGRPTAARGYAKAAAIKDGVLGTDIGGATCLFSTVLYNAGLLAGLDVVERRCHSVDSYGEARYFELGRDASIEYGYIDLRFRNPHREALQLRVAADEARLQAGFFAPGPRPFAVELVVSQPAPASPGRWGRERFSVAARRILRFEDGSCREEVLGESVYERRA